MENVCKRPTAAAAQIAAAPATAAATYTPAAAQADATAATAATAAAYFAGVFLNFEVCAAGLQQISAQNPKP